MRLCTEYVSPRKEPCEVIHFPFHVLHPGTELRFFSSLPYGSHQISTTATENRCLMLTCDESVTADCISALLRPPSRLKCAGLVLLLWSLTAPAPSVKPLFSVPTAETIHFTQQRKKKTEIGRRVHYLSKYFPITKAQIIFQPMHFEKSGSSFWKNINTIAPP